MRRSPNTSLRKSSADSQRLTALAHAMVRSSSRMEARSWEVRLDEELEKQMSNQQQQVIDSALDHLFHTDLDAYDILLDAVEAISSSCTLQLEGKLHDALLLAVPVLAWTRFSIPSGAISANVLKAMSSHLHEHVLAAHTHVAIAPMLFSMDQLPRTHCDTFQLTRRLAENALHQSATELPSALAETVAFLADTRYLLLVVTAESGQALLRWQEEQALSANQTSNQAALTQWQLQAGPDLQTVLPGCGVELLLPSAYYVACREADKAIRPISLRAAVNYLTHTLTTDTDQLSVVIAGFGDESSEVGIAEFRISFSVADHAEVYYGVVWPLYDEESAEEYLSAAGNHRTGLSTSLTPLQQIVSVLRETGITHIKQTETIFPPEFCDDCGTPMFSDAEEDMVHARMPEDAAKSGGHLH